MTPRRVSRDAPALLPLTLLLALATPACLFDNAAPLTGHTVSALAVSPDLGAAQTFELLAGTTLTSIGPSMIIGDVGVSPGTGVVGFPPATVTGGSIHVADGPAASAQNSLTAAYNQAAGEPCDHVLTGVDLGGMTLLPGVYCFATAALLTGTVTLDGMGNSASVWVIQIGTTLTTASSSSVNLIGSAIPGRVFWQVGSSATLGTGTQFAGNILAQASITATTGSNIAGRALARTGAVTVDTTRGQAVPTMVTTPDAGTQDAAQDAVIADDGQVPDDGLAPGDVAVSDATALDANVPTDAAHGQLSGGAWRCSVTPRSFGATSLGTGSLVLALSSMIASRRRRSRRP